MHEGVSDTLPTLGRERTSNPAVLHLMSHPFEQMAACAGLVLGGVLERHPKLRFVFLESGSGWLPYWLNRMDGHFETWGAHLRELRCEAVGVLPAPVLHLDGSRGCRGAFRDRAARRRQPGVGVGLSAHRFAVSRRGPKETLEVLAAVPEASRRKVLGSNALRLYGIEAPG